MNIISKIGTTPISQAQQRANDPTSPGLPPTTKNHQRGSVPPSLSTTALTGPGSSDASQPVLSEQQLRRQGLECLVAVLKSLVAWGTNSSTDNPPDTARSNVGEDIRKDSVTPDVASDKVSAPLSADPTRQPTPDGADDPSKFESAKQKKNTLLEGVKRFNTKPKRACLHLHRIANTQCSSCCRAFNSSSRLASFRVTRPKILPRSCTKPTASTRR